MSPGLGPREVALSKLADARPESPFDLLIVGGGVTGAGAALDAASRGLKVGLVERYDFGSGTSSKSSKLVHGGLRYLEQREFSLMRESSAERDLLRRLAPHLVEPIPFMLPVFGRKGRAFYGLGMWAYDVLATFRNLKVHRYVDADEAPALMPALPGGKAKGGYVYYDCRTDDVRLVMELLVQAVRFGSVVANYIEAVDMDGSDKGCTVTVRPFEGDEFKISARRVIVAAGVWTDRVEARASGGTGLKLRPSKGIHLLFARDRLPVSSSAGLIPDADKRRMLFVIPWQDAVLVGTTDTPFEGDLDRPSVEDDDRRYCLDALNATFDLNLREEDIVGAYAGLRPLIAGKAGETADLSRRHAVYDIAPGIIGITGGKLTTYRRMAKDAVDRIAHDLGATQKSRTRWVRLGSSDVGALRAAVQRRGRALGLADAQMASLIRTYGNRALEVLDVAASEDLTQPLVRGHPSVAAEAHYAATFEMAVHLADLLARRTRLALTDPAAGAGPSSVAHAVMGAAHGWSIERQRAEVEKHRAEIAAERGMLLGAETTEPDAAHAETG